MKSEFSRFLWDSLFLFLFPIFLGLWGWGTPDGAKKGASQKQIQSTMDFQGSQIDSNLDHEFPQTIIGICFAKHWMKDVSPKQILGTVPSLVEKYHTYCPHIKTCSSKFSSPLRLEVPGLMAWWGPIPSTPKKSHDSKLGELCSISRIFTLLEMFFWDSVTISKLLHPIFLWQFSYLLGFCIGDVFWWTWCQLAKSTARLRWSLPRPQRKDLRASDG